MMASTSERGKPFDWLAFVGRVIVIAALATWLLVERARNHDRVGVFVVVAFGYVILPALAYLHTRYYNSTLNFGVSEAIRRTFVRRGKD